MVQFISNFQLNHKSTTCKCSTILYHKYNFANIKRDLQEFANHFQQNDLASEPIECIDKHVPHKTIQILYIGLSSYQNQKRTENSETFIQCC